MWQGVDPFSVTEFVAHAQCVRGFALALLPGKERICDLSRRFGSERFAGRIRTWVGCSSVPEEAVGECIELLDLVRHRRGTIMRFAEVFAQLVKLVRTRNAEPAWQFEIFTAHPLGVSFMSRHGGGRLQ